LTQIAWITLLAVIFAAELVVFVFLFLVFCCINSSMKVAMRKQEEKVRVRVQKPYAGF
jgi:hypothetical protein